MVCIVSEHYNKVAEAIMVFVTKIRTLSKRCGGGGRETISAKLFY